MITLSDPRDPPDPLDRATATLYGLAMGDALGMPTQLLSRSDVEREFGSIQRFEDAAADHPLAAGMKAGSITDDTEQAVVLARHLVAHAGQLNPVTFAHELVAWEDGMRARGSLDLLGPSTRSAVAAIIAGVPVDEAGRRGATNGAAMRIAPVGILSPSTDLARLVDRVAEACVPTHNTGLAIAGASAVAAAISAFVDGAAMSDAIDFALEAARLGAQHGSWVAGADVARRIKWALELAAALAPATALDPAAALREITELVGTSLATQESVPAAFAILAMYPGDPWAACCAAASLGGDSDTIAAMVGAMAAASTGMQGLPGSAIRTLDEVNKLGFDELAADLIALR